MDIFKANSLRSEVEKFMKASDELYMAAKRARQDDTDVATSTVNNVVSTMKGVLGILPKESSNQEIERSIQRINQGLQVLEDSAKLTAKGWQALEGVMKELRVALVNTKEELRKVKKTTFEQLDTR